jgi:hypothetical protein
VRIKGLLQIGAEIAPQQMARHARPCAGIHVFLATLQDVDGRDKPGHDEGNVFASLKRQLWQWRVAVPTPRQSLNFA